MTEDVDVAVEEWEPRTSTLGVEEECVAVLLDDAIGYAAGGAGETCSSLLPALLFACAILGFLQIFVVFSRYIGDVVWTCMVRTSLECPTLFLHISFSCSLCVPLPLLSLADLI